jgi:cytochrome c553
MRLGVGLILSLMIAGILPANAQDIRALVAQCAYCHGDFGIAKDSEVPHLAGQQRRYLYTQLTRFRLGRRPHNEMRYMSRRMNDADMRAIAQYYSTLPPR